MTVPVRIPSEAEFREAITAYRQRERRGPVYFQAIQRVNAGWGDWVGMADGIGLLLRSWHSNFYRFGPYDPARLTTCIEDNIKGLGLLRERTIDSLSSNDHSAICHLFAAFTSALKGGKDRSQESTVATAKALHLLAPGFLPLWDNPIAGAYNQLPMWAHNYIAFSQQMKEMAEAVRRFFPGPDDCTVLKRLDEFNYAVYTKRWVRLAT